jgi:hypothetical protein
MSSQMEILSNKFNSLLTQYQDTYQEFLNTINSNNNTLTTVSNSSFVGQSNINTIQNSSVDNCLSSCNSNTSCSGATFDNNLNTCTLSSGTGNIINSNNQTAIVKQALYYSNQLKQINNELLSLNSTMMQNANSNMNNYSQTQKMNSEKAEILQNNYKTLEQERGEIEEIVRQYETLNSAYENGNINVTSNYYLYIIYLLVAIFLVFLFLRTNVSSNQTGGGHMKVSPLLLIFLAAVIIVNAYLKN